MKAPDCKACKHRKVIHWQGLRFAVCRIAPAPGLYGYFTCETERKWPTVGCGTAGNHFEAKRPWWAFWRKK